MVSLAGRASGFRFSPSRSFHCHRTILKLATRCEVLRSHGEPYGLARLRVYCVSVLMPVPEIERSIQRFLRALVSIGRKARRSGTACEPDRGERLSHIGVDLAPGFHRIRQSAPLKAVNTFQHGITKHGRIRVRLVFQNNE